MDATSQRMNAKIRHAQLFKIPYTAVIGDQEQARDTVAVRLRAGARRQDMARADFLRHVQRVIAERSLAL